MPADPGINWLLLGSEPFGKVTRLTRLATPQVAPLGAKKGARSDGSPQVKWPWLKKPEFQNGTLVSGNMDQNLRNPSCLILSHTQVGFVFMQAGLWESDVDFFFGSSKAGS